LRKKAANIRKKVRKAANSKTVTNPTDNGKGMKPLEQFFSAKEQFLQTSENPQHEQNQIDTQINVSLAEVDGNPQGQPAPC